MLILKKLFLCHLFSPFIWQFVRDRAAGQHLWASASVLVSDEFTQIQKGVIYLESQRQSICNWCTALIETLCWQRKQQMWLLLSKSFQPGGESKNTQKRKHRAPWHRCALNTVHSPEDSLMGTRVLTLRTEVCGLE